MPRRKGAAHVPGTGHKLVSHIDWLWPVPGTFHTKLEGWMPRRKGAAHVPGTGHKLVGHGPCRGRVI